MRAEIVFLDRVDSTNNYAMAAAESGRAEHGYTVVTRSQSAGRGQRGRAWFAGESAESLLMSTVLRPAVRLADQWAFSMAVSVAIRNAVAVLCPGIDLRIKWPNDLITGDKKVGGILIENSIRGSEWMWAVVGFGLNVGQTHFPPELSNATSLRAATGHSPRVEELARAIANALMAVDVAIAAPAYHRWLYRRGASQTFRLPDGDVFTAHVTGVSAAGELMVGDVDGEQHSFRHGEIEWAWPEPAAAQGGHSQL